jgi:hypothetical protein
VGIEAAAGWLVDGGVGRGVGSATVMIGCTVIDCILELDGL